MPATPHAIETRTTVCRSVNVNNSGETSRNSGDRKRLSAMK